LTNGPVHPGTVLLKDEHAWDLTHGGQELL